LAARLPFENACLYRARTGDDIQDADERRFTTIDARYPHEFTHAKKTYSYDGGKRVETRQEASELYPSTDIATLIARYNKEHAEYSEEPFVLHDIQNAQMNHKAIEDHALAAAESAFKNLLEKLAVKLSFIYGQEYELVVSRINYRLHPECWIDVSCKGKPPFSITVKLKDNWSSLGNPYIQWPLTFHGPASSESGIAKLYE
jgi:hypothetical protein